MTSLDWASWRAAEDKLAGGGDAVAAAKDLPPRAAWLFQAIAALEVGDRELLEGLSCPDLDLLFLRMLVLGKPGEIDPTTSRAALKRAGVPNQPFPTLDLLRFTCAAFNREHTNRHGGLAKASRDWAVLSASLMAISPSFKPYQVEGGLLKRSPRMAAVWAAAVMQLHAAGNVRELVARRFPGVEPLSEQHWPDLEKERPRLMGPLGGRGGLKQFLEDPLGTEWRLSYSGEALNLDRDRTREQRRQVLRQLLEALDLLVREGSPDAAAPVAACALELARRTPGVERRSLLVHQLKALEIRLRWHTGDGAPEIIEAVWSESHHLSRGGRASLAHELLERADGRPLGRGLRSALLAWAFQQQADWEKDLLPWVTIYGGDLDLHAFKAALKGSSKLHSTRAMAYLCATGGSLQRAMTLAVELFQLGAADDGVSVSLLALMRSSEEPVSGRAKRRLHYRALLELARTISGEQGSLQTGLCLSLLLQVERLGSDAERQEYLPLVVLHAARCMEQEPEEAFADIVTRVHILVRLGDDKAGRALLRDFGRWLRRERPGLTVPCALYVCSSMCSDEEDVRNCWPEDGTEPEFEDNPGYAWMRALTAWLDRRDTGEVGAAAYNLATSGEVPAHCLLNWYELVSDLDDGREWEQLSALAFEEENPLAGGYFHEILENLLESGEIYP